jgi:DNA-binding Xre family transcriptional regulator
MSKPEELANYQLRNMYDEEKHNNSHDIAGVKGITQQQMIELEKKKVRYRVDNELYLRRHPELQNMVSVFLFKVLEEKPGDILSYAGKFFDQ